MHADVADVAGCDYAIMPEWPVFRQYLCFFPVQLQSFRGDVLVSVTSQSTQSRKKLLLYGFFNTKTDIECAFF